MAKFCVGKASTEVVLRKSVLSMFVVGLFISAYAQENVVNEKIESEASAIDLSKVVVTASGYSQAIKDAPASISVISSKELTDKPISGLGPALKDVEGVSVERGGKSGGYNISIRGMPSDYTLILVDGKRLSQNNSGARPNGFGDVDTNFIPPTSAIEQIEVVRGPMSTLYGSDAIGGVVNIITKKVHQKWGGEVNVGYIQPESSKFSKHMNTGLYASGPLVKDTLGLALMAGFDHSTNAKGTYAKNQAELDSGIYTGKYSNFSGMGKKQNYNLGGKLSFTPNGENDIILSYDRGVQRYDNSDEQLGTLNTNIAPGKTGGGYADELKFTRDRASISHQGRYDSVTVDTSLLWDQTKTIGRLNPVSKPVLSSDSTNRDIKYTNIILDNKWMFALGDHFISAGMQYRQQELNDSLAASPISKKQWQWALFLEDEWSLADNFIATFGMRFDKNEDFGNHFSPRLYLTWNIDDSWQIKGGVSRAFKAPDVHLMQNDVVGVGRQGRLPIVGNADLKPETATSGELGVYFDNNTNFSANATAFYTKFKDKIQSVSENCPTPACEVNGTFWPDSGGKLSKYYNVDDAKLYGIELGARYQFTEEVGLKINYTYTDSSFTKDDVKRPFSDTPKHMVNAKLDWQVNEAWNVWAEAEYRGKQFNDLNWDKNKVYYKSYGLVNLGTKYTMDDNLSFSAGIYNLFDQNFMDMQPSLIDSGAKDFANRYRRNEEGRRFWLNAKYTF